MGSFSLWHWGIVLLLPLVALVVVGFTIWLIVGVAKGSGASAESRLQRLAALKSQGQISDSEYTQQRSAIIQSV
jgi:hypothetical protein